MMNNKIDQSESDYLKGNTKPLTTASSVLVSSSKYLNSGRLRDVVAQEMLRKWGHDVPPAFLVPETMQAFMELIDFPNVFRLFEEEKASKPEFKAWLDARFISDIQAEHVADCKPGTLGKLIHDFIFRFEPSNDLEYFHKRFSQGHDIQHMATGMGVDPVGETALIVLNTQSYFNYFGSDFAGEMNVVSTFLVSCNLMRASLHYPKALPAMLEAIRIGTEMGDKMKKPLFFVKWEDYFHNTIAEIREDLNLVGAPKEGLWDWTLDYMRG
jgi:ubiquinone biosynthesis protein Coq4